MGTVVRPKQWSLPGEAELGAYSNPLLQERWSTLEERMISLELTLNRLIALLERVTNADLPSLVESISRLTDQPRNEEVIERRKLSRSEAKREMFEFIQSRGRGSYSTIVEALKLDLPLVVELCEELFKEGKIEEVR